MFLGLSGLSHIVWDSSSKKWEMKLQAENGNETIGKFTGTKKIPLGVQTWSMKINCSQKSDVNTDLKLSKVSSKSEYSKKVSSSLDQC
jgi:hypothetical protein